MLEMIDKYNYDQIELYKNIITLMPKIATMTLNSSSFGFNSVEEVLLSLRSGNYDGIVKSIGSLEYRVQLLKFVIQKCEPIWPRFEKLAYLCFLRLSKSIIPEIETNNVMAEEVDLILENPKLYSCGKEFS